METAMPSPAAWLLLLVALLLPWLVGAALYAAGARAAQPGAWARQAGYGFFVGYAVLFGLLLLQDAFLGGPSAVAGLCMLLVVLFLVLPVLAKRAVPAPVVVNPGRRLSWPRACLAALFAALAVLHLALGTVEVFHLPVFPWDAWLSWMYRAKAWFHAGTMLPMDAPAAWAQGAVEHRYSVEGNQYPRFVPAMALWVALALGAWSETLVNLPFVLLAVALALAVYGEARALSLPRWGAFLCSYLLLSIPLLGTHLSLAGQADAWMAGYTGLGFAALLRGLCMRNPRSLLLGLALVAFSVCVKAEGKVWLLLALLLVVLCRLPRASTLFLAAVAAAGLLAWLAGVTTVSLPLFGPVGVVEGRLQLPFFGTYSLEPRNLSGTYFRQFVASGTWHLLWICLGLASLAAIRTRRARPALVFLLLLVATHGFVFMATEQGRWAEDLTAINRLPLQFTPALIIALATLCTPLYSPLGSLRSGRLVAAGMLSLGVLSLALLAGATGYNTERSLQLSARQLIMRVGQGYQADGHRVISAFDDGIAVASAQSAVDADSLPLLRLDTDGDNRRPATLFWRRADNPEVLQSLEINGRGLRWRDLGREPGWGGRLLEVGLLFHEDEDRRVRIRDLSFHAATPAHRAAFLRSAWAERDDWSLKSVNFLTTGRRPLSASPPLQAGSWLLIALAVAIVVGARRPGGRGATLLALGIVAWLALDVRWLAERSWRAATTVATYPPVTAGALAFGDDAALAQLVERAVARADSTAPLLLAGLAPAGQAMALRRARYHALPRAALVHDGALGKLPGFAIEEVLLLRELDGPGAPPASADRLAEHVSGLLGASFRVVLVEEAGILLRRTPRPEGAPGG